MPLSRLLLFSVLLAMAMVLGLPTLIGALTPAAVTEWSDFSPAPGTWITTLPAAAAVTATDADGLTDTAAYRLSTNGGTTWSNWQTTHLQAEQLDPTRYRLRATELELAEGTNFIQFRITDGGGQVANSPAFTLQVDTQPPPPPINPQAQPEGWTKVNRFGVTWSNPGDANGIGGAWYKLGVAPNANDDGVFVPGPNRTSLTDLTVPGDGMHTLWLWLADGLGHADHTRAVTVTFALDTQPPAGLNAVSVTPATWTRTNRFDLDWTVPTDMSGIAGVRALLNTAPTNPDDGEYWPGALTGYTGYAVPDQVEGEHRLWLWPVDGAGNAALPTAAVAAVLRLDTTPPPPPLTVPQVTPVGWQTDPNATFTVTWQNPTDPSGIAGACYKLGTAPTRPDDGTCVAGDNLMQIAAIRAPAPGSHHLFLWLEDGAGNRDHNRRGVAVDAVRWDPVAPELFIDASGPSGQNGWYRGPVNLSLIATDVGSGLASVQYNLNNGGWSEGRQLHLETDGTYTLQARATDMAGNQTLVGPTVFRIDAEPPVTQLNFSRPPGFENWFHTPITVTLMAADATSGLAYVEWRLNGGSWQQTAAFSLATEGIHTLEYRAVDQAGNSEPIRTATIKLDLFPPVTSYVVLPPLPAGGWYSGTVSITLVPTDSASGVAATFYRVNGGEWLQGTQLSLSESGEHSVEFYSVDRLGQAEPPYRIPGGIRIDRDAPRAPTPLDVAPRGWTNANDFTLTMALPPDLSGIAGAYVKVGAAPTSATDGEWRPGSSNILSHVRVPEEGRFPAFAWLQDIAGNSDPTHHGIWSDGLSLAYDASPPQTEVRLEGTPGRRNWFLSPVRVTLLPTDTLSGVAATWVRIDGADPVTTTTFTLTTADKHTLVFASRDHAGNDEAERLETVRIDPDPPGSPQAVELGPAEWSRANSFTVSWTNPPDTSGIAAAYYKVGTAPQHDEDGIAVAPSGIYRGITVPAEGVWDFYLWLVDQAGNSGLARAVVRREALRFDPTPPQTDFTVLAGSRGRADWYVSPVVIRLAAIDQTSGVVSLRYRVNDEAWQETANTALITFNRTGTYVITYQALDAAGNQESLQERIVRLDLEAPRAWFLPISRYQRLPSFLVAWNGLDTAEGSGLDGFDLEVKDGRNGAWLAWGAGNVPDTSARYYGTVGHRYFFRVRARDHAGHVGPWTEMPWGVYVDIVSSGDFAGGSFGSWRNGGQLLQSVVTAPGPTGEPVYVAQLGSPDYGPNVPGFDIPPDSMGDVPIGDAHITQIIRVPSSDVLDRPKLTIWYRIFTYDTKFGESQQKWFDTLDVRLIGSGGEWLALRDGLPYEQWQPGRFADLGWRYLEADIPPAWWGQTVTLSIENWNRVDGRLNTWSHVTDVRLWEPYQVFLPTVRGSLPVAPTATPVQSQQRPQPNGWR